MLLTIGSVAAGGRTSPVSVGQRGGVAAARPQEAGLGLAQLVYGNLKRRLGTWPIVQDRGANSCVPNVTGANYNVT